MKYIHFIPSAAGDYEIPIPKKASKFIADWYKSGELDYIQDGQTVNGMKRCIPFLDIMISGYMLVTFNDIEIIKNNNNEIEINWLNKENIISNIIQERKGLSGHTIPRPLGHLNNHLVWSPQWGWKTPRGYSTIITHPYNRFDLPFTTMSAIVDSDKYYGPGNIPFFLKENFEGVIPAGTPFAQIIPFKRKKWTSVYDPALSMSTDRLASKAREMTGYYKKHIWIKKEYN